MISAASQRQLRRLEWRVRSAASSGLAGEYRSAFRGKGSEFDQVVKYEYGDDIRDIDWNVTARRGEPYRKQFIEERELTIILLVEDSVSLQFGSGSRSKRDRLFEVASLFALLCATNRDRAGLWHAAPGRAWVRRAARGRSRVVRLAAHLLSDPAPPIDVGVDAEVDWGRFAHAFPRHSVVLWLGDFAPRPAPAGWATLSRRYEVVGVRVDDAWDRALPRSGPLAALDPGAGRLLGFDPSSPRVRARHAEWVEAREKAWAELFPSPARRMLVSPDRDALEQLLAFFATRRRALGI